jgi:hypothetical protein
MVLGMAGIFGGNDVTQPASAPATTAAHASGTGSAFRRPVQTTAASTFSPLLDEALKTASKAPAALTTSRTARALITSNLIQNRGAGGTITSDSDANPSLTLVNGLPPITPGGGATGTTTTPTTTTPTTTPATGSGSSPVATAPTVNPTVAALEAALTASGVDVSQLQFNEHQDLCTYPGGSYINDLITVQDASGQTADYMTNLVALNPQVTVTEIQEMMAGIHFG